MKIIMLAAGKGSRLMPLTANTPKMLVDLGSGKTLIETQLENIEKSGVIEEVVIVVGYCGEQIEAKLKNYRGKLKIKTVFNPLYEVSNNLITLWMAKHEMNGDFMITNGDNIFAPEVFSNLASNKKEIFVTTRKKSKYFDDDMKVIINNEIVERISKSIKNEESNAESVGLVLVSGEKSISAFKVNMEELVRDTSYTHKFWLEIFNKMSEKCIPINYFEISGENKWFEVDFHGDMAEILKLYREYNIKNLETFGIKKEVSNPDLESISNEIKTANFNLEGNPFVKDKLKTEKI